MRILEWVAIPFSKGSSCSRDQTPVSCRSNPSLFRKILSYLCHQGSPLKMLVSESCLTLCDYMDCSLRLFCPWNCPGNKHSWPSKPNILRAHIPSTRPLDWGSWCGTWIPCSLGRTSTIVIILPLWVTYLGVMNLDYIVSLSLLPVSLQFLFISLVLGKHFLLDLMSFA